MTHTPSRVWINTNANAAPDWVVEAMVTAEIRSDGSFDIGLADASVTVNRNDAVFEFNGQVHACSPRLVKEKLAALAGADNPVVVDLAAKEAPRQEIAVPAAAAVVDKPLKIKPMVGSPPAPQFVSIADLQVDDTYQRSIEGGASRRLLVKIAENWDWRLCLPLIVSRRGRQMFVIDGQHRLEGARLRGDIHHLPCVVFDFGDPKAEAELFVQANRSRRAMNKLDDFHAAVVAGDTKAVAINDVVTAAGLVVGRNQAWQFWKPGEVVFVAAVQRVLHTKGKATAANALGLIGRAFEGLILIGIGPLFEALSTFLFEREKDGRPVDLALMERILRDVGIPGWREAVAETDSASERSAVMLAAVTDNYNEAEAN